MIADKLPPRVVFVDPGTSKGHGVAIFDGGKAVWVDVDKSEVLPRGDFASFAVVEVPDLVFRGVSADIIRLARAAERAVARFTVAGATRYVYPASDRERAWKAGSKAQHQHNAWHALDNEEKLLIARFAHRMKLRGLSSEKDILAKLQERCQREARGTKPGEWVLGNVLDAVFMGLWAYGRIDEFGRY